LLLFAYGVAVGYYRWQPFGLLYRAKSQLAGAWVREKAIHRDVSEDAFRGDQALMRLAFTDPLIEGEKIYPPITSLAGIQSANQSIFVSVVGFESAYEELIVKGAERLELDSGATNVVRVRFAYQGRDYDAYAYGEMPPEPKSDETATLFIPGSGVNQSHGVRQRDASDHHGGIMAALENGGTVFVFVKPNEDFLAWHDGSHKLSNDCVAGYHLNRGGSYSASYIVQSIAFMKYLRSRYKKTIVAGLSQGGTAALLNAVQSQPDLAVIASGYSVVWRQVDRSGFNQILGIPFWGALTDSGNLMQRIQGSSTNYLFTWGATEDEVYGIEAHGMPTCRAIGRLANVSCVVHPGGHVFPVVEVQLFIKQHLSAG
jgi:hypothetical protein